MDLSTADQPPGSDWYEIRFRGRLGQRWSTWFDGMVLVTGADDTTVIRGPVEDQAALHGLLSRIRDIGLPLLSVAKIESDPADEPVHNPDHSTYGD